MLFLAIKISFLEIRFIDFVDVVLVAIILYQLYRLVRGSIAFSIFIGLLVIYVLSLLAEALDMQLMSQILGSFVSIGVLAVLIVFQPEIRRFLLYIGRSSDISKVNFWRSLSLGKLRTGDYNQKEVNELSDSIIELANNKTGALLVLSQTSKLRFYANTGV